MTTTEALAVTSAPSRAAAAVFLPRQPQPGPARARCCGPAGNGGLRVWITEAEGERVVHLEGDLDLAGVRDLDAAIGRMRTNGTGRVTVDATALRFIDLSGYRALLACTTPTDATAPTELLAGETVGRLQRIVELAGAPAALRG